MKLALVRPIGRRGVLPYHAPLEAAIESAGVSLTLIEPRVTGVWGRKVVRSPRFLFDLVRCDASVVLCAEYGIETVASALVARLTRRKVLVFQEHAGRAGRPLSRFDRAYRRAVARLVDGFLANTTGAWQEIRTALRVESERIRRVTLLVPPPVEFLRMQPLDLSRPRQRPLFVFVGRLIPQKNVAALLLASRRLLDSGRPHEVWLVGSGPDEERLRLLADELGLTESVSFLGSVAHESIGFVLEAADVFVMPTRRDYRSVAVLEAMRCGKAIIDSAADGNAGDLVRHGDNALVFDPADTGQLAASMSTFADDPALARAMGERSQRIIAEHTPERAAQELLEVVTAIARRPPAHATTRHGGPETRARRE